MLKVWAWKTDFPRFVGAHCTYIKYSAREIVKIQFFDTKWSAHTLGTFPQKIILLFDFQILDLYGNHTTYIE
jgi:hypothetical protein